VPIKTTILRVLTVGNRPSLAKFSTVKRFLLQETNLYLRNSSRDDKTQVWFVDGHHSRRASVHQAAKLVVALLRVAGVTAGLAESKFPSTD